MPDAAAFAAACARLGTIVAAELADENIDPASATHAWLGDGPAERAVVLLHGYTNSPQQWAHLGPELRADGHNVVAPRLPYHGYRDRLTNALEHLTVEGMLASALGAIAVAAGLGRRVDVIGLSVGGTLAAWLAAKLALEHVIVVAPFFGAIYVPGPANDVLAKAFGRLPNTFVWWDPIRKAEQLPLHAYPRFATRPLAEVLALSSAFERIKPSADRAGHVTLVVNSHEPIVNNRLASARMRTLEASGISLSLVVLRGLPYQHDLIEPSIPHSCSGDVDPVLRRLVRGESAPDALG